MDKAISEIVGDGKLKSGGRAQVYRALRSLLCSTCGVEIAEGSLFTRRRVKGIGVSIMPQCAKCTPFTLQAGKKEKSALLRSLLAEQPADSASRKDVSTDAASTSQAQEKDLGEAVRRRLGPALRRGRHKRG
ncbi:MAG TPA: hypothetical protein VF766_13580 [Pyrinomonadaceae bacterium]